MNDFDKDAFEKKGLGDEPNGSTGGATGIFGLAPGNPVSRSENAPSSFQEISKPVVANVHEVVFHAPKSGDLGLTDPLQRILNSPASVSRTPVVAVSSAPASGSQGFTQLLRALNTQAPTESATGQVASTRPPSPNDQPFMSDGVMRPSNPPPPAPGHPTESRNSFTSMFETLAAAEKPNASLTPMPTESKQDGQDIFVTPETKNPVSEVSLTPPTSESRFEDMFKALDEERDAGTPHVEQPQTATSAGSFTTMFETLPESSAKSVDDAAHTPQPQAVLAAGPAATPTFRLDSDVKPVTETSISRAAAGTFTTMFEAMENQREVPLLPPVTEAPQFVVAPKQLLPQAPSVGGITQLLRAMDAGPSAPGPGASSPTIHAEPIEMRPAAQVFSSSGSTESLAPPPAMAGGESFTQMFSAMDNTGSPLLSRPSVSFASEAQPQAAASAGGASFTQLFSTAGMKPQQVETQADSFPPVAPTASGPRNYSNSSREAYRSDYSDYSEPQSRMPDPPTHAPTPTVGGGLTQLLRTLENPTTLPQLIVPATSPAESGSSLTQTLNAMEIGRSGGSSQSALLPPSNVSSPSNPSFNSPPVPTQASSPTFAMQGVPPVAPPPAAVSGPGEFTRIIQASQFRESGQAGGASPFAPPPPAAAQPAAAVSPAMPGWSMPPMPQAPPVPQIPHASVPAGDGGAHIRQVPAMPQLRAPQIPALPQVAVAAPPKVSPALLIVLLAVIVLLIAALVVVMLMKK